MVVIDYLIVVIVLVVGLFDCLLLVCDLLVAEGWLLLVVLGWVVC